MKNKKYIFIGLGLILVFIASFLYYLKFDYDQKLIQSSVINTRENMVPRNPSSPPLIRGGRNTEIKKVQVSLKVLDREYKGEIESGASVFQAMKQIQEESSKDNLFSFKYKEYRGLGAYIDEINGKSGGKDGYWIYYVNEKEANVGVSNYKINDGDIISWKYEK